MVFAVRKRLNDKNLDKKKYYYYYFKLFNYEEKIW